VRTQSSSDAIAGVTGKLIRTYEGPYLIGKVICPTVEVLTEMESLKASLTLNQLRSIKNQTI